MPHTWTTAEVRVQREELRSLLAEGFDGKAWHGPTLRSALQGVRAEEALWRPGRGRHCIWEIVLHCAFWKLRVLGRVSGERERFPRPGANFPSLPQPADESAWRADCALLEAMHARLLRYVGRTRKSELDAPFSAKPGSRRRQLIGIAFHDVYHAGQIRLLRRLYDAAHTQPVRGNALRRTRSRPAGGTG